MGPHRARERQEPDGAHCGRRQESDCGRTGRHPGQHVRTSRHDGDRLDLRAQRVTFSQSVNVASPVYAGHDIVLANTATIAETIPASLTRPARPNRVAAGHNLALTSPQNQVGHVNGSADPANDLAEIHVVNQCQSKTNPSPHACAWGNTDKIWGVVHDNIIPAGYLTTPTLTCCSPVAWAAPADGATHAASPTSYMGFWYLNAGLGPRTPCATPAARRRGSTPSAESPTTRSTRAPIWQAARSISPAPPTAARRRTARPSWHGTRRATRSRSREPFSSTGARKSTSGNARYVGKGTIILSGLYSMDNNTELCVNADCGGGSSAHALGRRHDRPRDRRRRGRPLDRRQHRHQEGKLPGAAPRQRKRRRECLRDADRRPDRQRLRERQRRTERHAPVPADHIRVVGHGRADRPAPTPSASLTHPIRRRIAA